jgi:hypothetical protein
MNLWNPDGAVIDLPDEWCLTRRGWMRVDYVAEMIRTVAESSDIPTESYESVFMLTTSSVAGQAEVGEISADEAKAMVASIEGFFLRQ